MLLVMVFPENGNLSFLFSLPPSQTEVYFFLADVLRFPYSVVFSIHNHFQIDCYRRAALTYHILYLQDRVQKQFSVSSMAFAIPLKN